MPVTTVSSPAQHAPASAAPPAGTPGTHVLVPYGGGYVYVPLDASAMPTNVPGQGPASTYPGAAYPPATPAVPPAPQAPAAPPAPPLPPPPRGAAVRHLQTGIGPAGAEGF